MAFDTKKFIKEVEKKGVLWKAPTQGQAKLQEFKQKAWEEIGEIMFANWNSTTQITRDARVKEMKLLWKNIENKFYYDFKHGLLEGRKGRKYKEILSFLLLAGGDRQVELSTRRSKEKNERTRQSESQQKKTRPVKKKAEKNEKAIELMPVVSPSGELKEVDDYEEDSSFFKSMLPTLKKFSDQQRLDFRLEVLQALKKVRETTKHKSYTSPQRLRGKH